MKNKKRGSSLVCILILFCVIVSLPLRAEAARFRDVSASDIYAEAVGYTADSGLMIGVSDDLFSPDEILKRSMMATILYRLGGAPAVAGEMGFRDVEIPSWYAGPVMWGNQSGIIQGHNAEYFGAYEDLTREQMVTLLWRYAGSPTVPYIYGSIRDEWRISLYAYDAVYWAYDSGMLLPDQYGYINPGSGCTRADAAYALYAGVSQGYLVRKEHPDVTNVSIIGDSISTYSGWIPGGYETFYPKGDLDDVNETWWKRLADMKGWSITSNASWSGSFLRGDSGGDSAYVGCSWKRIWDLVKDTDGGRIVPDKILILMGANDLFRSAPIGSMEGFSPDNSNNFANAYGLMINRLQRTFPSSEIICLTCIPAFQDHGNVFINHSSLTVQDYNEVIRKISERNGVRAVDLYYSLQNTGNPAAYLMDDVHPTAEGARIMAEYIASALSD